MEKSSIVYLIEAMKAGSAVLGRPISMRIEERIFAGISVDVAVFSADPPISKEEFEKVDDAMYHGLGYCRIGPYAIESE